MKRHMYTAAEVLAQARSMSPVVAVVAGSMAADMLALHSLHPHHRRSRLGYFWVAVSVRVSVLAI